MAYRWPWLSVMPYSSDTEMSTMVNSTDAALAQLAIWPITLNQAALRRHVMKNLAAGQTAPSHRIASRQGSSTELRSATQDYPYLPVIQEYRGPCFPPSHALQKYGLFTSKVQQPCEVTIAESITEAAPPKGAPCLSLTYRYEL